MKYTWTTERGAQIALDIEIEVVTEETVSSDGIEVKIPCHEWRYAINSLTVNGKDLKAGAYKQAVGRYPDIHYAYVIRTMGREAYIAIPDSIEAEIYGAERNYKAAKANEALAAAVEYEKHHNAVLEMLNK